VPSCRVSRRNAFRVPRGLGVVSKKDRKQFRCSYLRDCSNDLARDSERARRKATGEALFAKFLPSSANHGCGPPVASSFSACRRALRRKRLGTLLQHGGPIAVGYGSAGDCRHTFARNQDAGQIKRIGSG
jgi:hypothetical protein